jgi:hypothetical protein
VVHHPSLEDVASVHHPSLEYVWAFASVHL